MVDAVNAVNAATRIQLEQRKDMTVDWNKLSAGEILEHAQKGEEVPIDILNWAEDYSKLVNVPDDVTYESVNGSTDTQDVLEETGEEENSEDKEISDSINLTAAGQDRQILVEGGTDLYEQGKVFTDKSNAQTNELNIIQANTKDLLNQGELTENSAAKETEDTVNKTTSFKKEYDNIMKKVQNDMSQVTPGDLNKLERYGKQLQQYGMRAQAQLTTYDIQLQSIEEEFSQYSSIPELAQDYGEVTKEIGAELIAQSQKKQDGASDNYEIMKFGLKDMHISSFRFMFDRDYHMGITAIRSGENAVETASASQTEIDEAKSQNNEFNTSVNAHKPEIEEATYVEDMDVQYGNEDKSEKDKFNQNQIKDNTDANKTKDLDKILTDPLEIQKRKERLGLSD